MIDFRAGEVQFVDHLAPMYLALPAELRGDFIVHRSIKERVRQWGIPAVNHVDDVRRPVVVASYGDHKRVRREGRRMIARAEHGAGQSYFADMRFGGNSSYAGGRDNHDASLILCPNEYSGERWRTSYPGARVEVIGCPKLDHLPAKMPGPLTIATSFHFDIPTIPETRWAWPTYKPVLPALAERFAVLAHCHPKAVPYLERYYRRMGIEIAEDFYEVCQRADVYVCDNSSTLFEFAATGRPVVVLNDPGYRRDVHHGGRFWDWAGVGLNVDHPARLVDTVARALVEDTSEQRERVLDQVYAYRSGAAARAAAVLVDWSQDYAARAA
jgi:hypothetical protein